MAEQPPLLFKKVLGGLRPASRAAEEAVQAIDGIVRCRITRTSGNVRRNGLYWAVLGIAAPMLEEKAPGLVRLVTLPSGETVKDYESISFAKMTEPERAKFIDWSLNTLSSWLGCSVEELRREGDLAA